MATRRDIIPPGMENIFERFHYAPGVLVDDTLYIAGQVGRNERLEVVQGTEAQFVQAFENVKKVLSAAGASGLCSELSSRALNGPAFMTPTPCCFNS